MEWKCIDVTKFTEQELAELCDVERLPKERLFIARQKGIKKLYYYEEEFPEERKIRVTWVGYTTKTNPSLKLFSNFERRLGEIQVLELGTMPELPAMEQEEEETLTVDGILDKISAQGMDSLTPEELNFLENQ